MIRSSRAYVILVGAVVAALLVAPSVKVGATFDRILIHFDDAPGGAWLPPDYYAARGVLFYSEAGGSGFLWNTPCPSVLDDPFGGAFSLPNAISGDRVGYIGVRAYFVDPGTGLPSTTDYVNVGVSSGPGPDPLSSDCVLIAFDESANQIAIDWANSSLQYDYLTVSVPGISWVKMVVGPLKEIWDDFIFESPEQLGSISGGKFYDSNVNGVWDAGEAGLADWLILLERGDSVLSYSEIGRPAGSYGSPRAGPSRLAYTFPDGGAISLLLVDSTRTDTSGHYGFLDLEPGMYTVGEVVPAPQPVWVPTTPTQYSVAVQPGQHVTGVDFGNVALGEIGARTIGYWKNHLERITPGMYAALDVLPAFVGCGNPDSVLAILRAPWPDMAAKLGAQLLAMTLNVLSGIVPGDAIVYLRYDVLAAELLFGVPAPLFNSAQDVLDAVEAAYDWSGWSRSEQEAVKDLLDRMNNDLLFVLPGLPAGDDSPLAVFGGTFSGGEYEAPTRESVLLQNVPNPFGAGGTTISFNVTRSTLNVSLKVYDLTGRLVRTLTSGERLSGSHSVEWDGRGDDGSQVANGLYFYHLEAGDSRDLKKMVVLR